MHAPDTCRIVAPRRSSPKKFAFVASCRKGAQSTGLGKAAARRLAEAGCTAHQIAAITGHRTLKEVQRYTVAADQKRLARDAMSALQQRQDETLPERKLPNRKARLGNQTK